eukprot:g47650.t1
MTRPPRTMIDSRTHLVQSIITTIGALRPPTENESPPLHPVSISWIAQTKMLQLLDPNLTPGKADAGLALRGFLRLLRSTCMQFRPATVSVHRWLPDIVKSTSCDSCPETTKETPPLSLSPSFSADGAPPTTSHLPTPAGDVAPFQ